MRKILFVGVALLVAAGAFAMGGADKGSAPAVPAVTQAGADKMYVQYLLSYAYDALDPSIDTATMVLHYSKHHAGYTNNLNNAVDKAGITGLSIEELLSSLDTIGDAALRAAIRNNGGGFYNHNLYFETMSPNGGGAPTGALAEKIDAQFGSYDEFKAALKAAATGVFGSGWAWLSVDPTGALVISSSPNQDNPIIEGTGNTPILGIDVWEHAYYLNHKNVRADYVDAFFNVIDWNVVGQKFEASIQ